MRYQPVLKFVNDDGTVKGHVVIDIDLGSTLSFLTGDSRRAYFEPYFKVMYSFIVAGLFTVALVLLYAGGKECLKILLALLEPKEHGEIPFGAVIYLTLALGDFRFRKNHARGRSFTL
jgi:hypothetical protein